MTLNFQVANYKINKDSGERPPLLKCLKLRPMMTSKALLQDMSENRICLRLRRNLLIQIKIPRMPKNSTKTKYWKTKWRKWTTLKTM